jgi:RND family efflux transporter MFP subunit
MGTASALAFLGLAGCSSDQKSASTPSSANAPTVAVIHPTREDLQHSVNLTAEFLPWQQVEIHAKVSGYVRQMNVDVGDHVKAGNVLAVLEIPEIDQELNQAKASILTAQQEEKSLEAESDQSNLLASRMNAAAQETKGLIAQQDIDTANDASRSSQAKLAAARQKVVEAQANAARLQALVNYAMVLAPFDGVVTRRYADVGALVQAGTVQQGTAANSGSLPLVSFAELKELRLEFPVPEADVSYVHVGAPVEVDVVSRGENFTGKVARLAEKVDVATRTMLTEVDVDNSDDRFMPGMYATVRLALDEKKNALAIPIQCVSSGDNPTVLVLNQNHQVEERPVRVGLETSSKAEILSGLDDDDLVVMGSRNSIPIGEVAMARTIDGGKL